MTVDSAGARFTKIYDTLREFRLSNMTFEEGDFYCLVDAMTAEGRSIDDGEEQMKELAAEIVSALDTLAAPASDAEARMWFVKDFADGWIAFDNEADAKREVDATGAIMMIGYQSTPNRQR